ncbi:MAG: hypothetical protein ACI9YE_001753 [Psychroserpens sp.]|jgi:uncharacterized protein YlzI (FlbEa/FlbD family)
MFLIQITEDMFINAEKIDTIHILPDTISLTLTGENESFFTVDNDFQGKFLNHLQALNQNIANIENNRKL